MEDAAGDPDICRPGYFHPLCVSSGVIDSPDGHKEIRVAIHLPSGCDKKELSVHVGSSQKTLDIYFSWPKVMTDVKVLHKYWLDIGVGKDGHIEAYHPGVVGFRNFFRSYRVLEADSIETTSRLQLPAKVETQIVKRRLRWKADNFTLYRVLYVTMRCAQDTYIAHSDEESIEAAA